MEPIDRWTILHFAFESIFFLFIFLQIDCIEDLKIEKKDKTEVCFRPPIYIVSYLSLPNNIWRLIVFAPFLIIIIIIIVLVLVILLSFRAPWTYPRQISGTTGQNFMKLGGVIDICF
jgi:hypothetical protein